MCTCTWRRGRKPPPPKNSHAIITFHLFLRPVRILGTHAHVCSIFLKLPGPRLKPCSLVHVESSSSNHQSIRPALLYAWHCNTEMIKKQSSQVRNFPIWIKIAIEFISKILKLSLLMAHLYHSIYKNLRQFIISESSMFNFLNVINPALKLCILRYDILSTILSK